MRVACPTRFIRDGFAVAKGSTTAHVKIGVAPGLVVTSSITDESDDDLGLKAGDAVSAGIKSSDVIIAKQRRPYGLKGGLGRSFGRALKEPRRAPVLRAATSRTTNHRRRAARTRAWFRILR
ncbi:MAG: TOBE domain-containing protein [Hyphomicrobium sp.]|nr:MAG: hypothetical protein F9K20_00925 [Hyphomicrobium sp.]MBZ0209312.1 TOBE domain-containing protein [Hyphomicrobium sp.]